jgi:hypothetical protein
MAKGDTIKVWMRDAETLEIVASQNGRTVEKEISKESGLNWLVIKEVTRGGTVIREMTVALSDVTAVLKMTRE